MNEPSKADMERAARVLESIARQECPHCGSSMLEEIGRSVYCGDCGARLYLGKCFPPLRGVATGEEPSDNHPDARVIDENHQWPKPEVLNKLPLLGSNLDSPDPESDATGHRGG